MQKEKKKLAKILLDLDLVKIASSKEEYFLYASGARGPIYCDNRPLISYVSEREWVMQYWWQEIQQKCPSLQAMVALATAGIPHGAWLAQLAKLPCAYIRAKAKDHGQNRLLEGKLSANSKIILIEDLVNRGSSSLPAVTHLKSLSFEVLGISSLVSYGFANVKKQFKALDVSLWPLITLEEILRVAELENKIPLNQINEVRRWQENEGL